MTDIVGKNYRVLVGDVRERLRDIPDGHFHVICTSPPYFQLRDYQTGTWSGGGADCDHLVRNDPRVESSTLGGGKSSTGHQQEGFAGVCGRCGATRVDQQIGLEETPSQFIAALVDVFAEVWRTLRDDGTLWVNIGDSYANGTGAETSNRRDKSACAVGGHRKPSIGFKQKDRLLIPHRLAIALQDWGWTVRDEIVWHKLNSMPESVQDRCTKAHEIIFMLTKQPRYFYDNEAVREKQISEGRVPVSTPNGGRYESQKAFDAIGEKYVARNGVACVSPNGKNQRSVWSMPSEPSTSDNHFAAFPSAIPARCIKAGTSEKGCCASCGAPYRRVTDKTKIRRERLNELTKRTGEEGTGNHCANTVAGVSTRTTGWEVGCDCGAEIVPCRVCDPFSGTGTTGMVATELGRDYTGIELNAEYATDSARRIESWKYRGVEKQLVPMDGQRDLFE